MTQFKKQIRDASSFLLSNKEIIDLKELCQVGEFLDSFRAIPATSSNLSLRTKNNSILISKSGIHKRDLNPSSFVRVNYAGEALHPLSPKPSDETLLHTLIYKLFPEANVVAHCHAREFEKFRVPNEIFSSHELLKVFQIKNHKEDYKLPVFENNQDMVYLSQVVENYFKTEFEFKNAFMIERHGIYCFGSNINQVQYYLEAFLHLASV